MNQPKPTRSIRRALMPDGVEYQVPETPEAVIAWMRQAIEERLALWSPAPNPRELAIHTLVMLCDSPDRRIAFDAACALLARQ